MDQMVDSSLGAESSLSSAINVPEGPRAVKVTSRLTGKVMSDAEASIKEDIRWSNRKEATQDDEGTDAGPCAILDELKAQCAEPDEHSKEPDDESLMDGCDPD